MNGSDIAYYSESETEWIDRTLTLEIPANSETNEWDIVSGKGESGGARNWEFKYQPEKQTDDFYVTFTNEYNNITGTSTSTTNQFGFYSDSYSATEIFDGVNDVWTLQTGSGSGSGMTSSMGEIRVDAEVALLLMDTYPIGGVNYQQSSLDDAGTYQSLVQHRGIERFKSTFLVDNGAWESAFSGKDLTLDRSYFDYKFDGKFNGLDPGSSMGHVLNKTQKLSGTRNAVSVTHEEWDGIANGEKQFTSYVNTYNIMDRGHDKLSMEIFYPYGYYQNSQREISQFYWSNTTKYAPNASEVDYSGGGYVRGDSKTQLDVGMTRNYEASFSGRIKRDENTGMFFSDGCVAKTPVSSTSDPANQIQEPHGEILIDYNDYTNFIGKPPKDQNAGSNKATHTFGFLHGMHYNALPTLTQYSVTLDFGANGSGVGVTFGEPITIPTGTFDTGIDKYLPEPEQPQYGVPPLDMTDIGTAVDPTWFNTIKEVTWALGLGANAGAGEVVYKFSLPIAWVLWKDEFKTLRAERDKAWIYSGLDGTDTQYWTQVSANGATAAAYAAILYGPATRALGNKMLSKSDWAYMNMKTYNGFETVNAMTAGQKYQALIRELGVFDTLLPSWRGLVLGTTTTMPLASHLPSVETVVIGIPVISTMFHGFFRLNFPELFTDDNNPSPPPVKIEKEP